MTLNLEASQARDLEPTSSTPEQLQADAAHLAARQALDAFSLRHEDYFLARGRRHPETGILYIQPNRALDRERQRLFEAYVATNVVGHLVDARAKCQMNLLPGQEAAGTHLDHDDAAEDAEDAEGSGSLEASFDGSSAPAAADRPR